MKRDFTFTIYKSLLKTLQEKGYTFLSYSGYCQLPRNPDNNEQKPLSRALSPEPCAPFTEPHALCPVPCAPFTEPCTPCPEPCAPFTEPRALSPVPCAPGEAEGAKERGGDGARERGSEGARERWSENSEIENPKSEIQEDGATGRFVILRHDVDSLPLNSLKSARLEHSLGIRGTYYFRTGPDGFDRDVIQKIASLGHEIGYHYETVDQVVKEKSAAGSRQSAVGNWQFRTAFQKLKTLGNSVLYSVKLCVTKRKSSLEKQVIHHAYQLFVTNLRKLRRIAPVSTICMHGSPLSPFDNREIWKSYDYREHGVLGEATLDTDFYRVFYLTDTGRRWDGANVNVRDNIRNPGADHYYVKSEILDEGTKSHMFEINNDTESTSEHRIPNTEYRIPNTDYRSPITGPDPELRAPCPVPHTLNPELRALCPVPCAPRPVPFHSTHDIIHSLNAGTFPQQVMITVHPQRWDDAWLPWLKELVWQYVKNRAKWLLIKLRG